MPRQRTQAELESLLAAQLGFLRASAESFDRGNADEARRLAVTLRTLLHDTGSSASLLGQLDMKRSPFLDTARPHQAGPVSHNGLTVLNVRSGGASIEPALDEMISDAVRVDFHEWWNRVVIVDGQQAEFSREDLVLAVADQDGGAHVDPEIDEAYAKLALDNSMGWTAGGPEGEAAIENSHLAAVRQIAHEVLRELDPQYAVDLNRFQGDDGFVIAGAQLGVIEPAAPLRRTKTPRNAPCHCGSGKKYKRCHGAST